MIESHHERKVHFFMLQIKIVEPPRAWEDGHMVSLEEAVNKFLSTIEAEAVKNIQVNERADRAIIQYEVVQAWVKEKCYDCKYWDDGGDSSSTSGLCVECGQRRRFNCNACERFKDIRG